jgi:Zn-dependent protease with chaperone function
MVSPPHGEWDSARSLLETKPSLFTNSSPPSLPSRRAGFVSPFRLRLDVIYEPSENRNAVGSARGLASLFSTHPPTEEHIARLEAMAPKGRDAHV